MQTLQDKTAFITGASSGIGAAIARALSEAGARVILAARTLERVQAVAAELPSAEALALDVRDAAAMRAALEGREIDILIPNAGLAYGVESMIEGNPEEWSEVIDTNVKGVLHALRYGVPGMVERGSGHVVFLGSVAGRQVYPGGGVYCASKHAVRAIYEGMRLEVQDRRIRFTTVDPAMVQTDFSRVRFRGDQARADAAYDGMTPLTPEDIARAVVYAVTQPDHVNVGEMVIWSSAQASTTICQRD